MFTIEILIAFGKEDEFKIQKLVKCQATFPKAKWDTLNFLNLVLALVLPF